MWPSPLAIICARKAGIQVTVTSRQILELVTGSDLDCPPAPNHLEPSLSSDNPDPYVQAHRITI